MTPRPRAWILSSFALALEVLSSPAAIVTEPAGPVPAAAPAPASMGDLSDLAPPRIVELHGPTRHIQGIAVEGDRLWATGVDRKAEKGSLQLYDLNSGELKVGVEVQDGDRIHPGGIALDGDAVWVPVAPYTRTGVSRVERRDKLTLELISSFEVPDHIGCVAVDKDRVIGANWDARDFYIWDKSGKMLEKRANPSPIRIQDMKIVDETLVASGMIGKNDGAVDWLNPLDFHCLKRLTGGKTDRGNSFMNEAMELREGRLYLAPEDEPTRVFIFNFK